MSQVSIIDIEGNHPQIPTEFIANLGSAIPVANQLEILGDTVANGTNPQPVFTTGSGNTITAEVQVGAAVAASPTDVNDAGLVSFDDSMFTVSEFGFVQLIGGTSITSVLTANATPQFALVGSTSTVDFGLTNLVLGSSLPFVTTGDNNVGVGNDALDSITQGNSNTAVGESAGSSITTASNNTAVGYNALLSATDIQCNNNTAIGYQALRDCIDGPNVAVGLNTMLNSTTAEENSSVGTASLIDLTTGNQNTAIGHTSLGNIVTGSGNTSIGHGSGSGLSGADSSNITIGNGGQGGDNNTIRIGSAGNGAKQQNRAFVAGITGVTVAGSQPVGVDTNGQLSGLGFGSAGDVLTSNGAGNSPTYQTPTAGTVTSVSGTADRITSTGGATPVIDIAATYVGQTSITTLGTVATGTWEATDVGVAHGGTGVSTITGLVSGNGTANMVGRTITGTANQIDVANGSGATANPTLSLPTTIHVGGISFDSGTNTLDRYTEGTWTPAIGGSGGNPTVTYTTQLGKYTRIGNRVDLKAFVVINTYSGGSGNVQITGLPFTSSNDGMLQVGAIKISGVSFGGANYVLPQINSNSSVIFIAGVLDNAASNTMQTSAFAAGDSFILSITYWV